MKADDWTYGTILRAGSARIMFIRWDRDPPRTIRPGDKVWAAQWFVGVRLTKGPTSYHPVGDTGRYQTSAWREAEEVLA